MTILETGRAEQTGVLVAIPMTLAGQSLREFAISPRPLPINSRLSKRAVEMIWRMPGARNTESTRPMRSQTADDYMAALQETCGGYNFNVPKPAANSNTHRLLNDYSIWAGLAAYINCRSQRAMLLFEALT